MIIIGLTGGIASGKSTVTEYLRSKGIFVIDSDIEAKRVLDVGTEAYYDVIREFSDSILNDDKTVNRKKLGSIVFKDKALVEKLNSITHPRVIERTKRILNELEEKNTEIAVIDAPLLIEAGMDKLCDEVWVVYVPLEVQIARAMKRDGSTREQVLDKIKNQMPYEEKLRHASRVLNNDGTVEYLYKQTDEILEEIKRLGNPVNTH